jgi:nitrate reductase alpha subunit
MGWSPSYPTFDRNPLTIAEEAAAAGRPVAQHVVDQLRNGHLRFAAEDPDAPENFPRILAVWRANLLGSSAKGNEYFLKHLLGTDSSLRAGEAPEAVRPRDVVWHEKAPEGKLDLLLSLDFRQTSTTLFSDVVLPAATWYEKHDLNTTDMHPYVHSFNPHRATVADPHRLGGVEGDRGKVQRAGGRPPRRTTRRGRRAADARHPGRNGQPARCGPRLEGSARRDGRV